MMLGSYSGEGNLQVIDDVKDLKITNYNRRSRGKPKLGYKNRPDTRGTTVVNTLSPEGRAESLEPVQRLGGGRGGNIFVPVLGGNSTKIAPTGDIFDQPPDQMRQNRDKLADHVGDHAVSSRKGLF